MIDVDFLILGSGVSGLYLAYQLIELGSVIIITKDKAIESNTNYAQGGIASVFQKNDSFKSHITDTINAGSGLCDEDAVKLLVEEGPKQIQNLIKLGASFVKDLTGELNLRQEGGHSAKRIVHANDRTGHEIEITLLEAVKQKRITILENNSAVELITQFHLKNNKDPSKNVPTCFGAYIYNRNTWTITPIRAKQTIIATGGAGQIYLHTTNPQVATGDGIALAFRAGADICNLEFFQFHPTTLFEKNDGPSFLISEVLRGHGAKILNNKYESFLEKFDNRAELAPRDIVARAIDTELKNTAAEYVYLDATHISKKDFEKNFPFIYNFILNKGYDMATQLIPIVPAAHYMCGGVKTDLWGKTKIENLFALGEVAYTGVHGGNRLGSNSLLEGLVFSTRITKFIKKNLSNKIEKKEIKPWIKEGLEDPKEWVLVKHNLDEIKKTMWDFVGIVRTMERLKRAQTRLNILVKEISEFYKNTNIQNKILELRNLALVSKLVIESALLRKESRGLHYIKNFEFNNETSIKNTVLNRNKIKI